MLPSEVLSSDKGKLTEHDFNLIAQAQDEFNKQCYDKCLETIQQLEQSMGCNYKIQHNKCIAGFYKNGCKKPDKLLELLENETDPEEPLKPRSPIVAYNKAVIYYHKRKYFSAIDILMPLVERLDDLEESIVSNVGVLVISCLLATNQLKRALAFLEAIQIHLGINLDNVAGEENSSPEILSNIDGFNRIFKLIAMMTNVLNRKTVVIPDDGTAEFAALKAHQYYLMKDFQMAAKQLSKKFTPGCYSVDTHGEDLDTCIANNMGIIHLRVRHYAVAAKFFQNAITFDNKFSSNLKNVPLHYLSAPRSREVLYNLGISMLHLKRPKEAFECFLIALKTYHKNPRLWFRLAEACIMFNEMSNLENEKKPIIAAVICPGSRRKFIFQPTPKLAYPENFQSAAIPETNLEFAALCLRNALYLYNTYKSRFTTVNTEDADTQSWSSVNDDNICNPSMPISKESFANLGAAIVAAFSYVSLRLGDYVLALEHARDLLRMDGISESYEMLGHMYSGEALIMMDKLSEARIHLEPKFISAPNAFDFETKDWQVKSIEAAHSIMTYNLVVCMIMQGELDIGKALLLTCTHPIVNAKVLALKTYLDIVAKGGA